MAHYTGPKGRVNRRLGFEVYDSNGAVKALRKRPQRPGAHPWRRGKASEYGVGLLEKQKIKHYYGFSEKQLRRFFIEAVRQPGNSGLNLMNLCERRLDNVIWRAGFVQTRPQARQAIAHGHFTINGSTARTPSQLVRMGDVIKVRDRANLQSIYKDRAKSKDHERRADFLESDFRALEARVSALPRKEDFLLPVEIEKVVEFMSR